MRLSAQAAPRTSFYQNAEHESGRRGCERLFGGPLYPRQMVFEGHQRYGVGRRRGTALMVLSDSPILVSATPPERRAYDLGRIHCSILQRLKG
jgi:hypothetical protein